MEILREETDYGMRALIHIAQNGQQTPVTARALANAEDIPVEFTYKILRKLTQAGFLKRRMGPHGGFTLAQDPGQITLLDVVEVIQGPVSLRKCLLDYRACPRHSLCTVSGKLEEFQNTLVKMLKNITLAQLLESRYPQPKKQSQATATPPKAN